MQRTWITGESGTGKTTLARQLGKKLGIPVYYRDGITWGKNDYERTTEEQIAIIRSFTGDERWIFEGNMFTLSRIDGRFDRCDTIIHLKANRFLCVYRCFARYLKHKNNPRPEFEEGCKEEYTLNMAVQRIRGQGKDAERDALRAEAREMWKDVVVLSGVRAIRAFYREHGLVSIK